MNGFGLKFALHSKSRASDHRSGAAGTGDADGQWIIFFSASLDLPHCLTFSHTHKWAESNALRILFSFFDTVWNEGHRPHVRNNTAPSQQSSKCPIHVEALLSQFLKIYPTDVVTGKKTQQTGSVYVLGAKVYKFRKPALLDDTGRLLSADFPVIQLLENLNTTSLIITRGTGEHPTFSADRISARLIWSKCLSWLKSVVHSAQTGAPLMRLTLK